MDVRISPRDPRFPASEPLWRAPQNGQVNKRERQHRDREPPPSEDVLPAQTLRRATSHLNGRAALVYDVRTPKKKEGKNIEKKVKELLAPLLQTPLLAVFFSVYSLSLSPLLATLRMHRTAASRTAAGAGADAILAHLYTAVPPRRLRGEPPGFCPLDCSHQKVPLRRCTAFWTPR